MIPWIQKVDSGYRVQIKYLTVQAATIMYTKTAVKISGYRFINRQQHSLETKTYSNYV